MATTTERPLLEALRAVPVFSDLEESQIAWFAAMAEDQRFEQGSLVLEAGHPADRLVVVLEGEIQARRANNDGVYRAGAGSVTGFLPFSRMTVFPSTIRAVVDTRLAVLHRDHLDEMLRRIPQMHGRLVEVLTDRVRESTRQDQQREKLAALGKLLAGLAHELHNPASAVRRSASTLRSAIGTLRDVNFGLCRENLSSEQLERLVSLENEVAAEMTGSPVMDALERSDREERIAAWLEGRGMARSWELAPSLVDAEVDDSCLTHLSQAFPGKTFELALQRMAATVEVEKTLRQIESAAERISKLVKAIKEYTYMDQAGEKEIDIHDGLESTLTMLHHDLKAGVNVRREYDRSLPRICARGSDLNQVWTNLIDNAIDAMKGKGELLVRTLRQDSVVLVEIVDNGPGIPQAIRDRIFDPFFTTKGVGEGTGLGLDTAYRIVKQHRGDIRVVSNPGETRFQVTLPIPKGAN